LEEYYEEGDSNYKLKGVKTLNSKGSKHCQLMVTKLRVIYYIALSYDDAIINLTNQSPLISCSID